MLLRSNRLQGLNRKQTHKRTRNTSSERQLQSGMYIHAANRCVMFYMTRVNNYFRSCTKHKHRHECRQKLGYRPRRVTASTPSKKESCLRSSAANLNRTRDRRRHARPATQTRLPKTQLRGTMHPHAQKYPRCEGRRLKSNKRNWKRSISELLQGKHLSCGCRR